MARLIDADALSDLLDAEYKRKMNLVRKGENHLDTLAEGIMSTAILLGTMPTVDAVPVVHGRWIPQEYADGVGKYYLYHCSECCAPNARERNYCPNCGAKMDLEVE